MSALAELLEAARDKRKCDERHSMKRQGCPECEADDMRGRTAAQRRLAAQAPALADELIEKRSAGQAMAEAIQHGSLADQVEARDRWAALTETGVRDG